MENNLNAELIAKAKQAKSPEELLTLAKENGQEFTEEQAKAYFEQMNKSGELADDELENVAGGGCRTDDGRLVVTTGNFCYFWRCRVCGERISFTHNKNCSTGIGEGAIRCRNCSYQTYENGLWLCNNPANRG